ncbi:hypothetical protein Dsin_005451 [Dipteronia sinensis]|uniref:Disease resistance R13L4/SHOC-2-like LRR domain-containing protein n=1 Tax=Dipteronia sinensis TaxID=43782 RepID=A0AAE0AXX4_9ROSI|nr:hypothetical protein Dsin_005451 [Dipteronia sinensis]
MKAIKKTIIMRILIIVFVFAGVLVLCGGEEDVISIAPMEAKEQEALYSAIQGFIGKWWNGSDLYPDPCGWTPMQGVSCDIFNGLWYVTSMNIGPVYDNSLSCTPNAIFTHHLFELKHLKSLSFFNCFFSSTQNPTHIPSSNWQNLVNTLESLEFRSNPGLAGTIPTGLGCLKNLQSLVILENGLTGRLPIELGNLTKLKRLVLAGNKFTGKIPVSFGGLTELLILDISRNHLFGSMPLTMGGLTSLLKLDLSNNMLEGKLPKELGNLKNLTLLDLRSNRFSGELTKSLEEMVSLKEMVISHNPNIGGNLTGIQWQKLENLEILDLSDMGLTGTIPEKSITVLGRLRFLGLSDNKVTGRVSIEFESMSSLSSLYVNGNNLIGKLGLSDWFYKKMGRRFGAWNNPNLCYNVELISTSDCVPYGVRPCTETNKRL